MKITLPHGERYYIQCPAVGAKTQHKSHIRGTETDRDDVGEVAVCPICVCRHKKWHCNHICLGGVAGVKELDISRYKDMKQYVQPKYWATG